VALSATKLRIIFVRATKILKNLFTRLVKQEKRSGTAPFRFELEYGEMDVMIVPSVWTR
jgi:hypothetical protein